MSASRSGSLARPAGQRPDPARSGDRRWTHPRTPWGDPDLEGVWTTHPKHGRQFKVERFTLSQPTTLEGLRRFLGSGLIKGVGPSTAERIVAHFGLETLDVIEQQPERLRQVPGIGAKRVAMIQRGCLMRSRQGGMIRYSMGERCSVGSSYMVSGMASKV